MAATRLSVIALLVALGLDAQLRVVESTGAGGALQRIVEVSDSYFEATALHRLAQDFVTRDAKNYRFAVLTVNTVASQKALWGSRSPHAYTFEQLVEASKNAANQKFNIARVIVLDESAVLQVRFRDGRRQETALRGTRDASAISFEDLQLRILHMGISPATLFLHRFSRSDPGEMHLWVRPSRFPSVDEALRIWKYFKQLVGFSNITIQMRQTGWWENPFLPLTFPFEPSGSIQYSYAESPWASIAAVRRGVIYTVSTNGRLEESILVPAPSR